MILVGEKVLSEPLLYVSLFFKQNRSAYYEKLQRVRTEGDWEGWISFYLTAVRESAAQATETAGRLVRLFEKDTSSIMKARGGMKLFDLLEHKVLITVPEASRRLQLTQPTIGSALERLEAMKIVKEITGRARDRVFSYAKYLEILSEGTEQIGSRSIVPASPKEEG